MTNYAYNSERASIRAKEERKCFNSTGRFALMKFLEYLIILTSGGIIYCCMEIGFRGFTHWSMGIVGGIALILVGLLNELSCLRRIGILPQMMIGGVMITIIEFLSGCIINLWLGWDVWNYSNVPFNVLGQVCLPFTFLWMLLAGVAIFVDDYIRTQFFHEKKPHYHLWSCHC